MLFADAEDTDTACRHLAECGLILDEIHERGWADAQTAADVRWYESFREQVGCDAVV